ncbi:MAG: hypothetical protein JKX79_04645 [Labilibaculum sp.]|nr:hypothetical protein [Labilibaculum sp.]
MNILTEIAKLLTDNDNSITTSLLKIKVLAVRLNNKALSDWVSKELSGYKEDDKLPKYRIYGCNLKGNLINGRMQYTNQVLPTNGLSDLVKVHLETFDFYEALSVLESYIKDKKAPLLQIAIPSELLYYLTENYQRMGNPYANVYSAHKEVGCGAVEQTLSEIRNIALDLILSLEGEFGFEIKMEDLIIKKNEVNVVIQDIMNKMIIKGDGNFINTGNENSIENKINISKLDFNAVRDVLKQNHVEEEDIKELEKVINEQPDYENKLFGSKVNTWIQKMTTKALDGTWSVGIGVAGGLLVEVLKKYYGM